MIDTDWSRFWGSWLFTTPQPQPARLAALSAVQCWEQDNYPGFWHWYAIFRREYIPATPVQPQLPGMIE